MNQSVATIRFKTDSKKRQSDEWLGPESHMPNLSPDLRRRARRERGLSLGWIVGSMFAAGVVVGSLVTVVFSRSRRTA